MWVTEGILGMLGRSTLKSMIVNCPSLNGSLLSRCHAFQKRVQNFIVFVVTEGVVCGIRLGQGEEITFPADCGLC